RADKLHRAGNKARHEIYNAAGHRIDVAVEPVQQVSRVKGGDVLPVGKHYFLKNLTPELKVHPQLDFEGHPSGKSVDYYLEHLHSDIGYRGYEYKVGLLACHCVYYQL